jgi:hypothetical protein
MTQPTENSGKDLPPDVGTAAPVHPAQPPADPLPNPEPAAPSLDQPDPGVFHHEPRQALASFATNAAKASCNASHGDDAKTPLV